MTQKVQYNFKRGRGQDLNVVLMTSHNVLNYSRSRPWTGQFDCYSRHWTVADEAGMYLTQRQVPSMALIEPSIHGDIMHLNAPGMSTLKVPMNPEVTPTMVKKVT